MVVQRLQVHEEHRDPRATAVIRTVVDVEHMSERLGECFGEITASLGRRGITPAGEPFVRYLTPPPGEMEIEIGLPVAEPVATDGRVEPGELPGGRMAVAIHRGPYERLGETYAVMMGWIAQRGASPAGAMWESYLTDPESEPDPEHWETEVVQPIA